jgi:formylglycine-generating enzyme required for sulfatase activity/tRNA A-37 threonylcarbamoyl transferase component Bud32
MTSPLNDPLHLIGTILADKYEVQALAGEGGFSVVYRAKHLAWDQTVALKFLRTVEAAKDTERHALLEAFVREGKLMIELSTATTAVVQARDVGTFSTPHGETIPYLVLEWLEGSALDDTLEAETRAGKPARSLGQVIACMDAPAEALALAHRRGIVHRDIKPSNIFLVGSEDPTSPTIKLLDFGIAKVMSPDMDRSQALQHTTLSLRALSPTHAAPEQFRRSYGATGPWTDVYAFALVLVEMLRGGLPALDGEDPVALGMASCDASRRPTPRTLGALVSDDVEAVFAKALAIRPADRYADMGDFWSALRSAAGVSPGGPSSYPRVSVALARTRPAASALSIPETVANAPRRAPESGTMLGGASLEEPVTRSRTKRVSLLVAAAGALTLGMLAVGIGVGANRAAALPPPETLDGPPSTSETTASAVEPTCPSGMAYAPGGSFFRGSNEPGHELWAPAHKVRVSPFCIDVHEVTAAEYKSCSDVGECLRPAPVPYWPRSETTSEKEHMRSLEAHKTLCTFGKPGLERHPINCVTWDQAAQYCKHLDKRLPTEAEWEFAARGSDGRAYPWGDDLPDEKHMNACGTECTSWQKSRGLRAGPRMYDKDDGFAGTAPVGSFPAGITMFGLHDMIGNVFEWTGDYMTGYAAAELIDPTGPEQGTRRVIRGGAFNGGHPLWVNPAFRFAMVPETRSHGVGFRCASRPSGAR